ncbi:hypothetical protein ABZ359_32855 [Streptomyces sp. NPDC005968]|uniref:hypothetical protein n=1 Tax=Streptomyces sp. NPDC005968 TaxID=3154574 RepID=UPI0033E8F1F3
MWALLILYQLLRRVMIEAAESRPGTDPDRCGFTIALHTARDLLVRAEGLFEQGIGAIGHRVLSALSPARRARVSTRKVKSPISRYAERKLDGRPDGSQIVTSVTVAVLQPPPPRPALPTSTTAQYVGAGKTSDRTARVMAILRAEPEREGQAREIAELLGDITLVATYRQLSRWAGKGLIKKVRTGRYSAARTADDRRLAPPPPALTTRLTPAQAFTAALALWACNVATIMRIRQMRERHRELYGELGTGFILDAHHVNEPWSGKQHLDSLQALNRGVSVPAKRRTADLAPRVSSFLHCHNYQHLHQLRARRATQSLSHVVSFASFL